MILAILDDLMFSSKIRSTANHLGVTVTFARSSSAALEQMRADPPTLVILDLNNARTDPFGTLAQLPYVMIGICIGSRIEYLARKPENSLGLMNRHELGDNVLEIREDLDL